MPLGARAGNASDDFYNGRNRQMDSAIGNHSKGVGASGGRPVKKLGVVAKAVAATMSVDRLQGMSRTQKDVKNGKASNFLRKNTVLFSNQTSKHDLGTHKIVFSIRYIIAVQL